MILHFGPFALDTDRAELRDGAGVVALEPKAYSLLRLLAENNDRVISPDEMIATIWAGRFVSDAAVSTVLKLVRKALGDTGDTQTYVRTVRGHGHRFVAPVLIRPPASATTAKDPARPTEPTADRRPTLAVLPFSRAGLPEAYATVGDAIPAEIISSLARLRWLRVIARESTFRFRGDTVDLAGLREALGAGYALSGRIEMFGTRLSVGVDLIETQSGAVTWSEHFDRPIEGVHEIRQDIVTSVIAALDLQIPLAEAALARRTPVERLDAWGAYHLGLAHIYRFNKHDNDMAARLFTRAISLDPNFSSAYAARSFTSFQNTAMGYSTDRTAAVAGARSDAERAVELDPLDPFATMSMGRLHIIDGHPDSGLVWLDRTVALSPNYAKGHYSRAFLQVIRGQTSDTRSSVDLAIGLSPLDPLLGPMRIIRAWSMVMDEDFEGAADLAEMAAPTMPSHLLGIMFTAAMCQFAGRRDKAAYWASVVREYHPDVTIGLFLNAHISINEKFRRLLAKGLREAGIPD